jgi:hypothetical protein
VQRATLNERFVADPAVRIAPSASTRMAGGLR